MTTTHLPDAIMRAIGAAHTNSAELCEATGITPKRMDEILAGDGNDIFLNELEAIANALKTKPSALIYGAEQLGASA